MSREKFFDRHNWEEELYEKDEALKYLTVILKEGYLGLLLGAGASMSLGFPRWSELVKRCCDGIVDLSHNKEKDIERLKTSVENEQYLSRIQDALYQDVLYDLDFANKDLIVALSSLVIGGKKTSVDKIVTLNYDDSLEWYLQLNGLKVSSVYRDQLVPSGDVEIIYAHGYISNPSINGDCSEDIVFSSSEVESFKYNKESFIKDYFFSFLKTRCFLAIGINPKDTLQNYITSYITNVKRLNPKIYDERVHPVGFAFVKPDDFILADANELRKNFGIIMIKIEYDEIPKFLFELAQKNAGFSLEYDSKMLKKIQAKKIINMIDAEINKTSSKSLKVLMESYLDNPNGNKDFENEVKRWKNRIDLKDVIKNKYNLK